jgi:UDP-N-acetylmuramate dehydrogenase
MKQQQNVPLKDFSTMRLGGIGSFAVEVTSKSELETALIWADEQNMPAIMIGDGSNIVWKDEGFQGILIINKIMGYEVLERDEENFFITVGSGENWDSVVERSVQAGLTGIEGLSWVPGTAGATPVQNVGAYGQEIADVFVSAEVYDREKKAITLISKYDCEFGYRTSRLKSVDHGRYFITAITLHLQKKNPEPPFYPSLQHYFTEHNITEITPKAVRAAVIEIRKSKLPDPAKVANNGSFFANPVVDEGTLVQIQANYPDVVFWRNESAGTAKLSAAWLIEKAGFKDFHDTETGMATWPTQSLVLVNEKATSTADLLKFIEKIRTAVLQKFEVTLKQEPELLPMDTSARNEAPAKPEQTESDLDLSSLSVSPDTPGDTIKPTVPSV